MRQGSVRMMAAQAHSAAAKRTEQRRPWRVASSSHDAKKTQQT
jgi:hypothetical protein